MNKTIFQNKYALGQLQCDYNMSPVFVNSKTVNNSQLNFNETNRILMFDVMIVRITDRREKKHDLY